MPITVRPSDQPLEKYDQGSRLRTSQDVLFGLFNGARKAECHEILQSSFSTEAALNKQAPAKETISTNLSQAHVQSLFLNNAFVGAATEAYSHHHHLVIRPDDVWSSILSQFNLFVNANAEELRSQFVSHKGQKELTIETLGTRYTVDYGDLAQQMTHKLEENIVDPHLRGWIMPDFTTTTDVDKVVSAITMMSTLQNYFSYKICIMCNLPAVTLLGEKSDWERLLARIDKLLDYGEQTKRWHSLLKPVLERFVQTFEAPNSKSTAEFWNRIVHYHYGGSGPDYLSGWITAFCAFDDHGKPLFDSKSYQYEEQEALTLDGATYHFVDTDRLPPSYCSVPVKLNDNGKSLDTVMVAGALACKIMNSKDISPDLDGQHDSIQPVAGWIMYEKGEKTNEEKERGFSYF